MIKKLLPILLAVIGTGAGVGAGLMLKPAPAPEDHAAVECVAPAGDVAHETADGHAPAEGETSEDAPAQLEYVKLNNQFIIPIMGPERVQALIVASLSIEIKPGGTEKVYAKEPKLRDVFLQVMFDHANIGGFEGSFTNADRMDSLRRPLLDAARSVLGSDVSDVLITEIARQDT
ncbi:flagellar basal body-associated protein FliL [Sagittula sp. S175]|uniref:flagellar basal body-associated protein FliL n=1 Tax=Sagittula sp. S175 TaxID=3415129 RepID=UPI003C7B648F